jgi:hypothetical protein
MQVLVVVVVMLTHKQVVQEGVQAREVVTEFQEMQVEVPEVVQELQQLLLVV